MRPEALSSARLVQAAGAQHLDQAIEIFKGLQENEFTERVLGGQLADQLEHEMKARIAEADQGVPMRVDEYWYYWYRRRGQQYKVHVRSATLSHKSPAKHAVVKALLAKADNTRGVGQTW